MIQKQESAVYNGYRGTLISKFELHTLANGSGSIGELLREGTRSEAWQNPCTGKQELIDYEELLASYSDINPNEAFLKISWNFIVEHDEPEEKSSEQDEAENPPKSVHLLNFGRNIRKASQLWPVVKNAAPEASHDTGLPDGKPITLINPFGDEKIHILELGIVPSEGRIKVVASYEAGTKAVVTGEAVTQDSGVRYPVAFANGVEGWLRDDYIVFE